ncbi:MAG: type II secretion system F family protein [Planctomycetes bacterium]|nr:type II secretion system F family protein [Planctomycetota bacterium]
MALLDGIGLRSAPDRLEELASALDAGLSAATAATAAGIRGNIAEGVSGALGRSKFGLAEHEVELLAACERAGRLPDALRLLATVIRKRTERRRNAARRLAYPTLLVAFACILLVTVVKSGGPTAVVTAVLVGAVLAAAVGGGLRLRRARRDPGSDPERWPIVGKLCRDASEAPYLTAMHALHGAGVGLRDAHAIAVRSVPFAATRARLLLAGPLLAAGRGFSEALGSTGALGRESLEILERAEPIGGLEDAFARAALRRGDALERGLDRASHALGGIAYAGSALLVFVVFLKFYGGWFSSAGLR